MGRTITGVALSPTGNEPATHWGGRGRVTDDFIAMIADAARAIRLPVWTIRWPIAEVLGALVADFRADMAGISRTF